MPPPRVRRRSVKSSLAKSGLLTRALNKVLTPGKILIGAWRQATISAAWSRGLMTSRLRMPACMP
ncbi:Uncharacterised protein [Bordetella pertussis]|nr:Uncharacterised protein [Bordetella pertussis]CPL99125.1 Uncharacterised protein [Bordetella pertussis]CPN81608.1 Uncharacterised protein [Bordetella pertussis]